MQSYTQKLRYAKLSSYTSLHCQSLLSSHRLWAEGDQNRRPRLGLALHLHCGADISNDRCLLDSVCLHVYSLDHRQGNWSASGDTLWNLGDTLWSLGDTLWNLTGNKACFTLPPSHA